MKIFKKIFTAEKEKSMGLSDKDLWRVYGTPLAFRIVAGRYCLNCSGYLAIWILAIWLSFTPQISSADSSTYFQSVITEELVKNPHASWCPTGHGDFLRDRHDWRNFLNM